MDANKQKIYKARRELKKTYKNEQLEYIQGQINKIRNSVEDKKSPFVWQTINEVNERKKSKRIKLKAACKK